MGAKVYRPSFDQSRFDNTQIGGDYYRQVANETLIPRIIERQKQALNVVPEFFHFYQRAYTGRRCSCYSYTETSPSSSCIVCFGTGNTGGYQLYGHKTEVFEATRTSALVNVIPDYNEVTRPISFVLVKGSTSGYIDFVMDVSGGINVCDLASTHAVVPRGTAVRVACKLFTEPDFVPLTVDSVTERLQAAQTTGGLHIRVALSRNSIAAKSPKFSLLRIRYKTLEDSLIRGDTPLSGEGNRSSEYGWFDDVDTKSLYIDSTLRSVTTEDLFRHVQTGRLWKAIRVTPNAPGGLLTSWSLDIRMVQDSERYAAIP